MGNAANKIILAMFLGVPMISFAQKDTIQNLEAVDVTVSLDLIERKDLSSSFTFLTEEDIAELAAHDVGELLGKFSGVNLKSYGGLGGLKTIDVRSIGSKHAVVNVDGFTLTNSQTSQVNFGQIQADNIVGLYVSPGGLFEMLGSVSSQVAGSAILIQTFENVFSSDSLKLRASGKYGSFGQLDTYLAAKYGLKKFFISGIGKFRRANGNYVYRYKNGLNTEYDTRKNNDFQDYYYGGTIGFRPNKNSKLRIGYRQSNTDQGLPGAVILYNQTADERLTGTDKKLFCDAVVNFSKTSIRVYSNWNNNQLTYLDPDFLNNSGGIDVSYTNRSLNGGVVFRSGLFKKISINGGVEQAYSNLVSSDSLFSNPIRYHTFGLLGASYSLGVGRISLQLSGQYVDEQNKASDSANDIIKFNPFAAFFSKRIGNYGIYHKLWYRNSFRMPSFNELYFNNIGNSDLKPETAHQFNYGFEITPIDKRLKLLVRSSLFFNRVNDKILGIPTKNLFVWSMQNISTVHVYGGEFLYSATWTQSKDWVLRSNGNYTHQRSIDVTPGSFNYGDQIAYVPVHTANMDISIRFKNTGVRISNNYISMRYSLNENIVQNEVGGFLTTDISVSYSLRLARKNDVRLLFTIKNIFNTSYSYVRSFVMPGRNYLITLSYAIN
jgi:outer membrane receptor protein involved in Fe transport